MHDTAALVLVGLTFLLAGTVKGVVGLGLPTVALALLTATLGLQPAMALLLVPSFVTNVWQALAGGRAGAILARIWPFLALATATVWIGAGSLTRVDVRLLSGLLGALLVLYAAVSLAGLRLHLTPRRERWAGPLLGAANGVLAGMTGSFVFPGVLYLQACGLGRDAFVQAMGLLFTASTVALALAMGGQRLLTAELAGLSAAAVLPALLGMSLGQHLRRRLSETLFRRVFLAAVAVMGVYILARAVAG
ncbi:sulfite exporter TauE/SafE family protein [Marinimicrococcus flavescens]|uniref:Probable membrane transporter protein n=1 Tax=Marinimicrococcus flavescens TaxID=3031815 RepID=A0AAP4D6P8_9PROT|nr:sulfite exporter TauE/SafE family protein [Marinimicrococcus flavescens]